MYELQSAEMSGLRKHSCGRCMCLVPTKQNRIIKKGAGKGQTGYWKCNNPESLYFNDYRVCDDGLKCKCFADKYETDQKTEEWIASCYADKKKKAPTRVRRYRSIVPRRRYDDAETI